MKEDKENLGVDGYALAQNSDKSRKPLLNVSNAIADRHTISARKITHSDPLQNDLKSLSSSSSSSSSLVNQVGSAGEVKILQKKPSICNTNDNHINEKLQDVEKKLQGLSVLMEEFKELTDGVTDIEIGGDSAVHNLGKKKHGVLSKIISRISSEKKYKDAMNEMLEPLRAICKKFGEANYNASDILSSVVDDLNNLKTQFQEKLDQEMSELHQEIKALKQENGDLKEDKKVLDECKEEWERSLEALKKKLLEAQKKFEELEGKADQWKLDQAQLKETLDAAQVENNSLKSQLERPEMQDNMSQTQDNLKVGIETQTEWQPDAAQPVNGNERLVVEPHVDIVQNDVINPNVFVQMVASVAAAVLSNELRTKFLAKDSKPFYMVESHHRLAIEKLSNYSGEVAGDVKNIGELLSFTFHECNVQKIL